MTAPSTRRPRALPFVLAGVVLVVIAVAVVRPLAAALGGSTTATRVDVTAALTLRGGTVHVRAELRGTGLTRDDVQPDLADVDEGYALNATTRTSGERLTYRHVSSSVAPDGHSATIEYDVAGDVVYVLPLAPGVAVDRLDVTVDGGTVASCLTQYGTSNGTPRLRPCVPGSGSPLALRRTDNGLERVRLTLA